MTEIISACGRTCSISDAQILERGFGRTNILSSLFLPSSPRTKSEGSSTLALLIYVPLNSSKDPLSGRPTAAHTSCRLPASVVRANSSIISFKDIVLTSLRSSERQKPGLTQLNITGCCFERLLMARVKNTFKTYDEL
jgi:hypothetical protein